MAYIHTRTGKAYVGYSTDYKPHLGIASDGVTSVLAADLPAGSTFYELDTGKTLIFDGRGWIYPIVPGHNDMAEKFAKLEATMNELLKTQQAMLLLMGGG